MPAATFLHGRSKWIYCCRAWSLRPVSHFHSPSYSVLLLSSKTSLSPTLYLSCHKRQFSLPGVIARETAFLSCSLDDHNCDTLRNNFGKGVFASPKWEDFWCYFWKIYYSAFQRNRKCYFVLNRLNCMKDIYASFFSRLEDWRSSRLVCKTCDLFCVLFARVKDARNTTENCNMS